MESQDRMVHQYHCRQLCSSHDDVRLIKYDLCHRHRAIKVSIQQTGGTKRKRNTSLNWFGLIKLCRTCSSIVWFNQMQTPHAELKTISTIQTRKSNLLCNLLKSNCLSCSRMSAFLRCLITPILVGFFFLFLFFCFCLFN